MNHNIINLGIPDKSELHGLGINGALGPLLLCVLQRMDAFTLRPLYGEKYVVLLPMDHPLTQFDTLRLDQLSGQNYVDRLACEMRQAVLQTCESSGIELDAKFRSEREDWVQSMVASGLGFAFIPEHAVLV
jgi:DNA-binding transcriptional LysR family regulator